MTSFKGLLVNMSLSIANIPRKVLKNLTGFYSAKTTLEVVISNSMAKQSNSECKEINLAI